LVSVVPLTIISNFDSVEVVTGAVTVVLHPVIVTNASNTKITMILLLMIDSLLPATNRLWRLFVPYCVATRTVHRPILAASSLLNNQESGLHHGLHTLQGVSPLAMAAEREIEMQLLERYRHPNRWYLVPVRVI